MPSTQDDLTLWMNEAGRFPLLSKEEVLIMTRQIQKLPIESGKRKKLINKLVLHNLRLVISFVHPFMDAKSANKWGSVETLDYLQVGTFGLFRAAEKYNPDLGYAFSTYATYWIRSFVGRYNMKASSPFKISEEACRSVYSYERYGKLSDKAKVSQNWKDNPEQMCQLIRAAQSPVSLYSETESGTMLIDLIEIQQPEKVEFYDNSFTPQVEEVIAKAKLSEQEDTLIRAVFIDGSKHDFFCDQYGISRDKFSKLKARALKKIRKVADPAIMEM